ncbi:MAG: hypothetical protein KDD36_08360 [Flavobacteriales bacterium]|nr:hypothetical protein [Flavobacteriales bacterium]
MKRTDQLHELIKSLSQTEKRYFKMFSNMRGKGGTNYLNLFEAIERMKVYDEGRLKEKFKGSTLSKHLPSEKNYLYHLILKSLRAYHSDATKNNELSNLLQSIEILFDKGMFTHCLKLLAKARKLAYRYEKHTLLLDILKWEQKITRARFDLDNLEENVDETLAEEHRILSDLQAIAQYKISFYKLTTFIDNRGIARSESELQRLDNIMSGDFIRSIENATSYEGRIYYYLSWADYHYARGNLKEDYKISQELVNFIESKPELLQQDKRPHINGLSYLAIACTRIGMFDEARKALNDLKK